MTDSEVSLLGEISWKAEIGKRIREARELKGWTQRELATVLEVSSVAVGHWENGRSEPNLETIFRIAETLGQQFTFFIPGEDVVALGGEQLWAMQQKAWRQEEARIWRLFSTLKVLPVFDLDGLGVPPFEDQSIQEHIPLPASLASSADLALKVSGDGLAGTTLRDGDMVLVAQRQQPQPGDLVLRRSAEGHAELVDFQNGSLVVGAPGGESVPAAGYRDVLGVCVAVFAQGYPFVQLANGTEISRATLEQLCDQIALRSGVPQVAVRAAMVALGSLKGNDPSQA